MSTSGLTLPTRTEVEARHDRAERLLLQAEKHLERGNTELARAAIAEVVRVVGRMN